MGQEPAQYTIGQWVVHSQYGVGQINQTKQLSLHGNMQEKELCFQVQTKNGVFWFPVDQTDNPRVRPIITKETLKSALKSFQEPPEDTEAHHNVLKGRINEAQNSGSITVAIKLVRDLAARNSIKRTLNILEDKALKLHTERIAREWALCMGIQEKEARQKLDVLINSIKTQVI